MAGDREAEVGGVGVLNQFDSCEISSLVLRQPNYKHMLGPHRDALPFP